ncbi:class I mannose-6-phosphate isomerase [Curtobacterium sp. RRHDQ10]|uniref:class I mannose-6-phosphate isomerase n=1 Tax=Curtobacterium phyllosphaerae TaxID=3413379 RepID=UPI003BF24F98
MTAPDRDATRPPRSASSRWAAVPTVLEPNQPADRPYRGGAGIASFRRREHDGGDPHTPEDFVGSTTTVHGSATVGLTTLEPGLTLRDAIVGDPAAFLGPEHVAAYGADPMLLVKLLDTGERLFVHLHPSDEFAARHLHEPRGKTEAWAIIAVEDGVDGFAAVGFHRPVPSEEAARWFAEQDVDAMLGAMHRVPLAVGSTLLVPAGVPHAIGPGITLVELQQPTDLSILLEWDGYDGLTVDDATLGIDPATALAALDRRAWDTGEIASLAAAPRPLRADAEQLFPPAADRFFRAERVHVSGSSRLEAAYGILVVTEGVFDVRYGGGSLSVVAGDTVLVPFGVGEVELVGEGVLIRAMPPLP